MSSAHNVDRPKWASYIPGVAKTKAPKYEVLGKELLKTEENNDHSDDVKKATSRKLPSKKGNKYISDDFILSPTEEQATKLLVKGARNRFIGEKILFAALGTAMSIVGTPIAALLLIPAISFERLGNWQQDKADQLMAKQERAQDKKEVLKGAAKPQDLQGKMQLLIAQVKANKTLSKQQKQKILKPFLHEPEPTANDVRQLKKAYSRQLKEEQREKLIKKIKDLRYKSA